MSITVKDVRGISSMVPTPCKEGEDRWDDLNTVDLEETATMTENLVQAGIGSIAANGTTGECAALLWEEKVAFIDTMVQVNRHRVPIFAGATSLGTKETVRQMRALRDIGAEGAFIGLPLWQTPTLASSVQWFADLSEAVPDMGIMVYSNSMFFKSFFPLEFWEGVAKRAPTVITNKIASPLITEHLEEIVRKTGDKIAYLPIDFAAAGAMKAFEAAGRKVPGMWSTSSCMGPEPVVALWEAIDQGDEARIKEIEADLHSVPSPMPSREDFMEFLPKYNVQFEKARFNAAGYIKAGPPRPPYREPLPDHLQKASEEHGKGWAQMRKKYMKAAV